MDSSLHSPRPSPLHTYIELQHHSVQNPYIQGNSTVLHTPLRKISWLHCYKEPRKQSVRPRFLLVRKEMKETNFVNSHAHPQSGLLPIHQLTADLRSKDIALSESWSECLKPMDNRYRWRLPLIGSLWTHRTWCTRTARFCLFQLHFQLQKRQRIEQG